MVTRCIDFLFQAGVRSRPGLGQLRWQVAVTAQRDLMKAASSRSGYEGATCCLAGVMCSVKTALKKGFWCCPLPVCRGCPGKARRMRRAEPPGAVCHMHATTKASVWPALGESFSENSRLPHAKPVSGLIRSDPRRAYGCWYGVWRRRGRICEAGELRWLVVENAPRGAPLRWRQTRDTHLLRVTSEVSSVSAWRCIF